MHPDVDLLCLLALGEDAGTEDDRDHARTCAACSFEVEADLEPGHLSRG